MKVALIGAGRIGLLHARSLVSLPDVDELIIASGRRERAEAAANEVGARSAASVEAALDDADATVITSSTDAHASLIRASIARGLPTFCEKPMALDLATSMALRDEIESSGMPFQLGFQRRFDPAYAEARRLIASGELGTLYYVNLSSHDPAPGPDEFIATSGGTLRDLSIHDVDMLRFLTGSDIVEVYARGSVRKFPVFARHDDVDTVVAVLETDTGLSAQLSGTRHDPLGHDVRAEIFGSRDSISVGLGPKMPLRSVEPGVPPPAGPPWRIFLDRWDAAYRAQFVEFMRLARGEIATPSSARDGVEAQRAVEAMIISAGEHRIVPLTEIPS